jgi:hypothetical protein
VANAQSGRFIFAGEKKHAPELSEENNWELQNHLSPGSGALFRKVFQEIFRVSKIKRGRPVMVRSNRTDMHALKSAVKVKGLWAIDKRSLAAKALFRWKRDLIAQLGGIDEVTPAKMCLVDLATRTRLFIEALDAFLVEQKSLINRSQKSVIPVLLERQQLVDSMGKLLKQIGLQRQHGKVLSLKEYWSTPLEVGHDEAKDGEAENDSGQHGRSAIIREDVQAAAVSKR